MENKPIEEKEQPLIKLNPLEEQSKKLNTETDPKKSKNKIYIGYKDLLLNYQTTTSNESNPKNEEDIKILQEIFNIQSLSVDSFKHKEYKLCFISNKNIIFINEYTVKYIGKGVSKIDYGIVQSEKEIDNKYPIFYFEVYIINDGNESDISVGIGEKDQDGIRDNNR